MRRLTGWAALVAMAALTVAVHVDAQAQAPVKKTTPKSKSASKAPAGSGTAKKGAAPKSGSKTAASKKGKKGTKQSATTWRNRQLSPGAERYREIQSALAAKGYLRQEEATGTWNEGSVEALKRFQADQNIAGAGKINSLSLIALGLGPKYEAKAVVPPSAAPQGPDSSK